jgi:glyoxylase-like metal-dependent hydrolase (beta-lactamase superfamily II)
MEVIETNGPVVFTGDVGGVRIGPGNPVVPPCPPPDIQVEDWLQSIQLLRELPAEQLFLTHYGLVEDKTAHLDALEAVLKDWAEWMRPHAVTGTAPATIVPQFEEYVRGQLQQSGVEAAVLESYEKATPAFMSVAGLLRYWKKKGN